MKKKNCSNCKHFKQKDITYGVKIGECNHCTSTSIPYAGDFAFTGGDPHNPDPLKVCGNFGCIRFEPMKKQINWLLERDQTTNVVLSCIVGIVIGIIFSYIYYASTL